MSDKESFLSRWSRKKQEPETPSGDLAPAAEPPDAAPDDRTDDQILAELDLPDPATLKPGDDITGFMQAAVPARLRRAALRQLWRSNPVLANLDELLEYGEDYTDAATVVENLQTAYRVGRGFWTEEDEERAAQAEDRDAADQASAPDTSAAPPSASEAPEAATEIAPPTPHDPPAATDAESEVITTKRRMTFSYES